MQAAPSALFARAFGMGPYHDGRAEDPEDVVEEEPSEQDDTCGDCTQGEVFYALDGEAEPQRIVGHPVFFEAVPAQQQEWSGQSEGGKGRQPVLCAERPAQQQQLFESRQQKVQHPSRSWPCSASLQQWGPVPHASWQHWVLH